MEIKPFLHEHFLCYDKLQHASLYYDYQYIHPRVSAKCTQKIVSGAYSCESCNFWVHQDCAQQQLPVQITHALHSEHFLDLSSHVSHDFICDKCVCTARGFKYSCKHCSFNVDYFCALKTNEEGRWRCRHKEQRSIIKHFIHQHGLSLFSYRKISILSYVCAWCQDLLSGRSYGCLDCDFFLHESCIWEIPKELQHPFHPSHHLYLQFSNLSAYCNACKGELDQYPNRHYCCYDCNFWLHIGCARLLPTLKNNCHEHDLTYLVKHSRYKIFACNSCGGNCCHEIPKIFRKKFYHNSVPRKCAFYLCVQCDLNFDFDCASIQSKVKHRSHRHELPLKI
ncbi:uncharacterized protein LOC110415887 [Herrania umbratica]|uniref:Uncharacterized protein LOC110415887 n=1 Tax=Herrania umbratica TaxID=108875 RepID=A0A6J1A991_9ROSI|nr:uncharacterized protein LOC110415887 [Herrania umbratica]